jgi:hypothetical protein
MILVPDQACPLYYSLSDLHAPSRSASERGNGNSCKPLCRYPLRLDAVSSNYDSGTRKGISSSRLVMVTMESNVPLRLDVGILSLGSAIKTTQDRIIPVILKLSP